MLEKTDQLTTIRRRHLALLQTTCAILGHILKNVSQAQATSLRDGPNGWTTLEVVAHLRDFDGFFRGRAALMLAQDYPQLPAYDHERLAIERNYNGQQLDQVYAELVASRQKTADFFKVLSPEQWQRAGLHPERGHFTMTDAVIQVGTHDITHIEQITRLLNSI
jgi:hypothetical protein